MLVAVIPALADDSTAALQAGSVVFVKNTPIRMASEDLYISPRNVRIRFEFYNPTNNDIRTLVAFPLPDIDVGDFWEGDNSIPSKDPVNFVNFKAIVDGKPVKIRVEQRAFFKGKDVTKELLAAGVPLNPVVGDRDIKEQLVMAGLAKMTGSDRVYSPDWTVRTKFFWNQVFPAKKTVVIEHSYNPVSGASFVTEHRKNTLGSEYCLDSSSLAAVNDYFVREGKAQNGLLQVTQTDYILKTASNWNGPIGHFHLTLDTLKADNVLGLCWKDGKLKKTGSTTFEFTRDNFAPANNIHMTVFYINLP